MTSINKLYNLFNHQLHYNYLHISFKQSHGINKNRTVAFFICICSELENVLLMVLPQVAFKHLPNQGFLYFTYQHEEPVISAHIGKEKGDNIKKVTQGFMPMRIQDVLISNKIASVYVRPFYPTSSEL